MVVRSSGSGLGPRLRELIAEQDGLVSRAQLLESGLTRSQAWQRVRTGRWQVVADGVYATFTGPLDARMRVWTAILALGPPAAASHRTALWLEGLIAVPPDVIQVCVPNDRNLKPPPGTQLFRRRDFGRLVRPSASPPRIRFEASLLDAVGQSASSDGVLTLVFAATQRRFTTVNRLRAELALHRRHVWRALLIEVLADVEVGVASALERRYLRDVERPHGLPRGARNKAEKDTVGKNRFKDVRYRRWRTVVELDGRGAHPEEENFRDWRRDNTGVISEEETLRYGWHDVVGSPCEIATQVEVVLRRNGWLGALQRCPRCATVIEADQQR